MVSSMNNKKTKKEITVCVSGGFDPVHIGHVRLFKSARKLGDKLVVILNNDNWLTKKKGYSFMPSSERKEIIEAFECVDKVFITKHTKDSEDMSVSKELEILKPDIFANGGDRTNINTPEKSVCAKLGIRMVFNIGKGGKIRSSSSLLKKYHEHEENKK